MKLMIAGSRSIVKFDISPYITNDVELIITGGAKGIDFIAEDYADKHKISKLVLRPNYNKYKKAAPLKRNESMIELADKVLVVWDGVSKGSLYTINYAQKIGKQLQIVSLTGNEPIWFKMENRLPYCVKKA